MIACLWLPDLTGEPELQAIAGRLAAVTSRVEPVREPGSGLLYADLAGLSGPAAWALAEEVRQQVGAETGLAVTVGLAGGKFPARMAALAIGLNRRLWVIPGQERSFLAPFAVDYLPLDETLARQLRLLGLRTLGQLAALPGSAVLTRFGASGQQLQRLARGRDERPVLPWPVSPTLSLTHSFDDPVTDRLRLNAVGGQLSQNLAGQLDSAGLTAAAVQLTLLQSNGGHWAEMQPLRESTADPARLTAVIEGLLARARLTAGITAITISLPRLVSPTIRQLGLLAETASPSPPGWLAELAARYGADRFCRARLLDRTALLPEERFELRRLADE